MTALKLLQLTPLCPDGWKNSFSGIGSIIARDRGGSLERLHRPNRFRVWLHEFEGVSGFQFYDGLGPVYPQCGPYEALEGIYPGCGQRGKLGEGKDAFLSNSLEDTLVVIKLLISSLKKYF